MFEVTNEADIVHDLVATAPAAETFIKGVVLEHTPTGDRPVAGALAFRWPVYGASSDRRPRTVHGGATDR